MRTFPSNLFKSKYSTLAFNSNWWARIEEMSGLRMTEVDGVEQWVETFLHSITKLNNNNNGNNKTK